MTREKEIEQASVAYQMTTNPRAIGNCVYSDVDYKMNINPSFIAGAEWADQNPNKKLVYTKQELYNIGFGFTTNGDIINPYEDIKEIKRQVVEKACNWLKVFLDTHYVMRYSDSCEIAHDIILEDFRGYMEL